MAWSPDLEGVMAHPVLVLLTSPAVDAGRWSCAMMAILAAPGVASRSGSSGSSRRNSLEPIGLPGGE